MATALALPAADERAHAATAIRQGRFDRAEDSLRRVIEQDPRDAVALHDLGVALAKQRELDQAIGIFQRALALRPDSVDTRRNLGVALAQAGRKAEAAAEFQKAVQLSPASHVCRRDWAAALKALGKLDDAAAQYREVIRLREQARATRPHPGPGRPLAGPEGEEESQHGPLPEDERGLAAAYHDLGLVWAELKNGKEAEDAYRRAVALNPEFPEALNNLGILLEGQGRLGEAETAYREALAVKPAAADVHNNLGVALAAQRKYEDAVASYRESLRLSPDSALALNNLGNSLRALGQVEQAVQSLRRAIRLKPDYAEAYNNLGIALVQLGRDDEAVYFYERALHFRPDYPEAHLNRSLAWLAAGDFERGWPEYEWRWMAKDINRRSFRQRRWDGGDLHGKTLFIYLEQGVGDTLQFIRYARLLKQRGARVIVEAQKSLLKLLSRSRDIDQVVPVGGPLPDFDLQVPLLSLPGIFRTTAGTIPDEVSYLFADPELVEHWRARLASILSLPEGEGTGSPSSRPLLVGVAWQGNKQYRGDRQRSVPLKLFGALARLPGVRLVSLQKGFGAEQVAELDGRFSVVELEAMDEANGAFMDTAAVMKNLDLVITSDTAIPHLAGALGVPVWLALPKVADWRWMRSGEQSPWYPTMRIFRQRIADDWEDLFESLAAALHELRSRRAMHNEDTGNDRRREAERAHQAGLALAKEGQLPESEECLARAVELHPAYAAAQHNLGVVQARQKRIAKATRSFEKTIRIDPGFVDSYGNLGLAYYEQGRFADAAREFRQALRLGPGSAETWNNLGVALMQQALPQEAAQCYRRAVEIRPDYAEAHQNLGRALLTMGQFEQGWLELEWRHKLPTSAPPPSDRPRWDGSPLAGRTLLLYAEQGLGDTLQFARFATHARCGGGRVILQCQPALARLLAASLDTGTKSYSAHNGNGHQDAGMDVDEIIAAGAGLPAHDVRSPLMSLPSLLRLGSNDFAAGVPYLRADEALVRQWRGRLSSIKGFKVGIAWQGNPSWAGDQHRSVPLEFFQTLAEVPDVRLVSLQKGAGAEQLAGLAGRFHVADFGRELDVVAGPFMDTTALILNLDLVVASDTAIAHLAGALGVPVWLALNHAPDWRWMLDRHDSPWYPNMRLFRQERPEDWPALFIDIARALRLAVKAFTSSGNSRHAASDVTPAPVLHQQTQELQIPTARRNGATKKTAAAINLSCPVNPLGYGTAGLNILKALTRAGAAVTCWPIGRIETEAQDRALVEEAIDRQKIFDGHAPSVRIAHQNHLAQHVGHPRIGFPIFELDRFTPVELNHLRGQDQLLVTSRWAKEVVEACGAASPSAVHVVHLGVDREVFCERVDVEGSTRSTSGSPRATVFLSVGKWERRKGHDVLLEAFNKAFAVSDDVELWMLAFNPVIADDRAQTVAKNQEWETLYRSSLLGAKIRFLPRMAERREVAAAMRQADCGVFLSRAEGWNLPALEMMSCGKPLIITNYSAHTEYCNPANALLIDIDALEDARDERWFSGQGRWAALGAKQLDQTIAFMRQVHAKKQAGGSVFNSAGIETARQFTWNETAAAILKVV